LGDNQPLVELALRRLRTRIVEEGGSDLNIDEFDAGSDQAAQVVNAANTLAFLSGTRLVLAQNVQAWNKAEKMVVAAYLESPAPDACLALVAVALPPKDPLRLAVQKRGDVLEYPAPKEAELPAWLVKQAASRQMRLGLPEARLLVQRCGAVQSLLLRELEKLQAYVDGRQVEAKDIRLLTTPTVEANIFSFLDSLAQGRGREAFSALEELMASGETTVSIFYRILRNFQNMEKVAALREQGLSQAAIQSELKMKPYPVKKLSEQAAQLGTEGIGRRLAVLAETDARLKGMGTLPAELEMELCVGKLLAQ